MPERSQNIASALENQANIVCHESCLGGRYFIQFQAQVAPLPLLQWLKKQNSPTKVYWSSRQGDIEIAGIGLVDSIDVSNTSSFEQALSTVQIRLDESGCSLRYYGGLCFDGEKMGESLWKGFGQFRFIVPEYEITRNHNTYTLVQNFCSNRQGNVQELKRKFREFLNSRLLIADQLSNTFSHQHRLIPFRRDIPSRSDWIAQAEQVIKSIRAEEVEKVVLAQKADLICDRSFNPVSLLEYMKHLSTNTYSFLFRFPGSAVFLGSSPECLFKKEEDDIYSEALAGTRPITDNQETNLQLQKELCRSPKESQEHDFVAVNIEQALRQICCEVHTEPRDILRTGSVQHLCTSFRGRLTETTTLHQIINALHPTAAVNGIPPRKALEIIRLQEPFSRGWYAGAIGWIASERAEFAVGIRSALVQEEKTISLFSGAGLVKESDPSHEWAETELKKQLILDAFKEIVG